MQSRAIARPVLPSDPAPMPILLETTLDHESLKTALEVYKIAAASLKDLWTAFTVVTLGLVGFVYKSDRPPRPLALAALTLAFAGFITGNHIAVRETQRTLFASAAALRSVRDCNRMIGAEMQAYAECALQPARVERVRWFHGLTAGFVVLMGTCRTPTPARGRSLAQEGRVSV